MVASFFIIVLLLFTHQSFAQLYQGEHCDLGCLLKKLNLTIELGRNDACASDIGTAQMCFKSININSIELGELTTTEDNVTNPQSLTVNVGVNSIYAKAVFWLYKDTDAEVGEMEFVVKNIKVSITLDFETEEYLGYNIVKKVFTKITVYDGISFENVVCTCYDGGFFTDHTCWWIKTTVDIANGLLDTIVPKVLESQMSNIEESVNTALTDLFVNVNDNYIKPYIGNLDPQYIPVPEGMMNITESSMFDMISWATTYLLGGNTSLGLNNLINRFTQNTGNIVVGSNNNDTFSELSPLIVELLTFNDIDLGDLNATLDLGITFFNISGLNTCSKMEFFEPLRNTIDPATNQSICNTLDTCDQQLKLSSALDRLEINITFALNITSNSTTLDMEGEVLHEEGNLYIKVTDNYMEGRVQVAIPEGQFEEYSNNQCTNITCWLALFQNGTGIPYLQFNTSLDSLHLNAGSPDATSDLDRGVQSLINSVADVFINRYKAVIPVFLNGLVNNLGTGFINDYLNDNLNATCEENPDPEVKEYKPVIVASTISIAVVLSIILCAIAIIVLVVKWRFGKNHEESSVTTTGESKESDSSSEGEKEKKPFLQRLKSFPLWFCKQWLRTDEKGASLFLHPRVNIVIRVIMPFLILLNIALFITSNTGTGATVNAYISIGSGQVITMPVSDFGLMNSVEDMWTAGVYPLAVLIMVFSGIWPYTKLVILLFTWFMPSTLVVPKVRGIILKVLDALGKWSMLDSYVMVLMIVAFYFDIPLPIRHPESINDPVKINLYVYPAYGFVTL
ncbi:hypothetical protein KM1_061900, partial [Entamoeba histolytica HM-3:IMSS]